MKTPKEIVNNAERISNLVNKLEDSYFENATSFEEMRMPALVPIINTEMYHLYIDLLEYFDINKPVDAILEVSRQYGIIKNKGVK